MKIKEFEPTDEVFVWEDPENFGDVYAFNVTAMQEFINTYPKSPKFVTVNANIDNDFIEYVKVNRGIEQECLDKMTDERIEDPMISVLLGDRSVLLVDGHHRLISRANRNMTTYRTHVFKLGDWDRFMIDPYDLADNPKYESVVSYLEEFDSYE